MNSFAPFPTLVLVAILVCAAHGEDKDAFDKFEKYVRPILVEHCVGCHGPKKQQGSLRLDARQFALKGNESGPAVVARDLATSRLIQVIRYSDDDVQMPPKGKLSDEKIAVLESWIRAGAPWPDDGHAIEQPESGDKPHWAFRPIKKATPPPVDSSRVQSPIDQFVIRRLTENNLQLAPPADRHTLIRRLSYDLTGLPPMHVDEESLSQGNPKTCDVLVDDLLNSKHFGERFARHWMDVARYADTKGYLPGGVDRVYHDAWKYRDWLIEAYNADVPFTDFVAAQLAADRVARDDPKTLAAMGFLTLGRRFLNNGHDVIDDRIDVVTRGLMGLTVTCARCHDHKYDPIPTADYYSLYGVFASSHEPGGEPFSLRMVDRPNPYNPAIFIRGNPGSRGKRVPRQFPAVVAGANRKPFQDGSGRLEMAQAIVSADNPLTARVYVNRVWSHLIGKPLVDTPSDFGVRSSPPTHPELLDWLATFFIESGWSTKKLVREIVRSATYCQSSTGLVDTQTVDPENRLLSHMNRKRLDFEAYRDSLLAAAGQLDRKFGGPSVKITTQPFSKRRTVYAFINRQNLPGVFRTFDFALPDTHSPQRYQTTVPQQGLFQFNNPFLMQQAEALATATSSENSDERIRAIYRRVFQREPRDDELRNAQTFISLASKIEMPVVAWQFGSGRFDQNEKRVVGFSQLPHFDGKVWQGGEKLPDPKMGWCHLRAEGGHPGHTPDLSVIRRWTAPADGIVSINGQFHHPIGKGDGVRGQIVSSRAGLLGEWTILNKRVATNKTAIEVRRGDTIDFVTDCVKTDSFDTFHWRVELRLQTTKRLAQTSWNSVDEFSGPSPTPLDAWAQYAQALLLSNEFVFVD